LFILSANKNIVPFVIITLLLVLGAFSYDKSDFEDPTPIIKPPKIKIKPNDFNKKTVPVQLLTLNTKPSTPTSTGNIAENLHGRFFYDRAEFYIIKEPKNKIHSSSINSITLVYLDDVLCKTKYSLSSNIVDALIKKHGAFNITGYDLANKELISLEEVMIEKNGYFELNKKLDNYQLSWQSKNTELVYRANSNLEQPIFDYTERRIDYENRLRVIEYTSQ